MEGREAWRAAAGEWRDHWRVGLAAFVTIGLSFGAFQGVSSLFVIPLQEAFGWSRGQIAFAHNAALAAALSAPFLGRAIDRFGVRRLMLGGMTLSILIYIGLASMNGSLPLFYALYTLAAVIGLTASGLTCSRVVSEAFVRSRGLSLAIARSGLALANAALPTLLFLLMARFGWRAGYIGVAALVGCVALPAVFFWIGRSGAPGAPGAANPPGEVLKWRQMLKDRRILALGLGAALGYAPANAIMSQLQPILIGKGIVAAEAANLVGLVGLASLGGAILTGALIDRFWAPAVALVFACGSAAGTAILALSSGLNDWTAGAAVLLIGLGLGAEIDVVAFMVARYFGVRSFASIYGLAASSIALAGALGASLLGAAYDRFGHYDYALLGVAACFVTAGFVYLSLGRYPDAVASPVRPATTEADVPSH